MRSYIVSDGQDETREFAAFFGLPEMVVPEGSARVLLDLVWGGERGLQVGDENGGVEVLAQLRDAGVLDGPNVHPEDARGGFVGGRVVGGRGRLAFDENPIPYAADAGELETEGVTRSGTGEQAHHVLLAARPIEPPLEIRVH